MKLTRRLLSTALSLMLSALATLPLAACKDKHTHTFGAWTPIENLANCEGGIFERVCSECKQIDTRTGTAADHDWSGYGYNATHHWPACKNCAQEKEDEFFHQDNGSGSCLVCNNLIPTESVTYTLSNDETYAIVTGYDEMETDVVVIAPTYEGVPVTAVQDSAFKDSVRLERVTLPESITSIGAFAFSGCQSLTGILLRKTVTEVGEGAFEGCKELMIFCEAAEKPSGWHEKWNVHHNVRWSYTGERATPISARATRIADSMLREENNDRKQIITNPDLDGVRPPNGFSFLTRFDSKDTPPGTPWTDGNLWHHNWNQMNLTEYSDVWFAAKVIGGFWAFVDGADGVKDNWLYLHLQQTGTSVEGFTLWKIEASIGGYVHDKIENQIGRAVDDNRPTNSIARLLWDEGFNSLDKNGILIYHAKLEIPVTIYCTEVLGIKKGANSL